MIAVADSFYAGTWGSGTLPEEIVVFEVCREFRWTVADYFATPVYWRRVFGDLLNAARVAENDRAERERRRAERGF